MGRLLPLHKIVELLQRPLSKLQKARRGALASPRRGERHPPPSPTKADAPKVDTAAFLFAPSGRCHCCCRRSRRHCPHHLRHPSSGFLRSTPAAHAFHVKPDCPYSSEPNPGVQPTNQVPIDDSRGEAVLLGQDIGRPTSTLAPNLSTIMISPSPALSPAVGSYAFRKLAPTS